ncbi:MAG: SAM-dependent chlorinase/fluorinase [Desulfobacterales bacterium]|nr:SAM-dependent chlorinase/fluorinase [Desulfobacterales bacterium]
MPVITMLTDFGTADEYVGVMKGVILSICPSAAVIDISHRVEPQDRAQAAYLIPGYFHFFPPETIHLVVVDPGVGSQRAILAVHCQQHFFIAPDNGVLTLLLQDQKPATIIRVENTKYFLKPLSATFHGRDIFAALAGHMACGTKIEVLGSRIRTPDTVQLGDLTCQVAENGTLVGKIVSIDRFGNLITNIDSVQLRSLCQSQTGKQPQIHLGSLTIRGMVKTYADAKPEQPLALIGSRGYLEIALNFGNAQQQLKARKGDLVRVTL